MLAIHLKDRAARIATGANGVCDDESQRAAGHKGHEFERSATLCLRTGR